MGMKLNPLTGKFDSVTTNAKAIDGIKIISSDIGDGKILSYSVADNAIKYVSQTGADGTDGVDGASITSAAFTTHDIVFTKDDATTVTLIDGKDILKGEQGDPGPAGPQGEPGDTSGLVPETRTVNGLQLIADINLTASDIGAAPALGLDDNYVTSAQVSAIHTQNTDTGTDSDTFSVGDGSAGNKGITANNGDTNKPELRYNDTSNKWEYSNDGTSFSEMGTGSGGTTVIAGEYDFVQTNYPSAESEQYVYKLGGSSGSVVTTVTINFTDSSKQVFENYTIS